MEFIGNSHGFTNKMFWIATSFASEEFKTFLEDDLNCLLKIFPDLDQEVAYSMEYCGQDMLDYLIDNRYLGFIAEVHIPKIKDLRFDESGNPVSYTSSGACCIVKYIYSEHIDELAGMVAKIAEDEFQAMCRAAKRKA